MVGDWLGSRIDVGHLEIAAGWPLLFEEWNKMKLSDYFRKEIGSKTKEYGNNSFPLVKEALIITDVMCSDLGIYSDRSYDAIKAMVYIELIKEHT